MVLTKCSAVLTFLFHLTLAVLNENEITKSPCPHIFSYRFDGGTWFGLLKLPNPTGNEAQVKIIFALEKGVEVSNDYNEHIGDRFGNQIPLLV